MTAPGREPFDPIGLLRALDERRVKFIIIGALGRVIHGSGEITSGVDVVPALTERSLGRLSVALADLDTRRRDGGALGLEGDLARDSVLDLVTSAGSLKLVPEPTGTRGYDDLRRDASREPLGRGVRPEVASIADHARMLAALGRDQDTELIRRVRRIVELDRGRSRGWTLER